jgi:hypothetical protein
MKHKKKSEDSAFGAMIMFISVFVISSGYILFENMIKSKQPDEENVPKGLEDYALPAGVREYEYAPLNREGLAPSSSAPEAGGLSQTNTTKDAEPLVLS